MEIPRARRDSVLASDLLPLCILWPWVEIDLGKDTSPGVTVSAASETGGGVTTSKGVTQRGGAKVQRAKLRGQKSSLFFGMEARRHLYSQCRPKASVKRILENVASMTDADRDEISERRKRRPIKCCSSCLVPMRRPRLLWPDWQFEENEDIEWEEKESFVVLRFNCQPVSVRRFLGGHEAVSQDFTAFP